MYIWKPGGAPLAAERTAAQSEEAVRDGGCVVKQTWCIKYPSSPEGRNSILSCWHVLKAAVLVWGAARRRRKNPPSLSITSYKEDRSLSYQRASWMQHH